MSLVVENEIQWLTEIILPKILRNGKLIDDYNESLSKTFQVKSIAINVIGVDEAYMLTICYRATIELKYAGQELQKKLFIKKTPKLSAELYDVIQFDNLFNNEVIFYTEILPVIQELSNGKFAAPKYYYSEINADAALIILSDFASDGWNVTKDLYGLSLEHARIAVKYLGTFHGFGFAMKHKQPQHFQQLTAKLREARFAKETLCAEFALKQKVSLRRAERAAALYQPQVDKEFISKFQQLIYNYIGYGRQRVAPREPLATLCHGDYLRNNVAFKYDTNGSGTPLDIMMFDYQTMRLSSPMIDLSVFLALSLLAEVRYTNFDTLFDGYCNALAESYRKHSGQQLPEFLSRENLLKEYIQFLPYAINITSYFLMSLVAPLSTSPAENFESEISTKEIVKTAMNQGGELVDREIAHQLKELYELSRVHNVQIDENIDTSRWSEEAIKFINNPAELCDTD